MIVKNGEVTNQLLQDNDIVAVEMPEFGAGAAVNIVKNRFNGVTGLIPITLYNQIIEDYNLRKEVLQSLESESETVEDELFEEIFGSFTEIFEAISKDTKKARENIKDEVKARKDEITPEILNTAEDLKEILGGAFSDIMNKIQNTANEVQPKVEEKVEEVKNSLSKIKVEVEIAKLIAIKEQAINAGVATKGFLKKIDKEILRLKRT